MVDQILYFICQSFMVVPSSCHPQQKHPQQKHPRQKQNVIHCHIVETEEHNDYQEYFQYVSEVCALEQPNDWRDALQLYKFLLQCACNGET